MINGKEIVVGAHAIGKGVDEMMQGISIAVTMGATKQDFEETLNNRIVSLVSF